MKTNKFPSALLTTQLPRFVVENHGTFVDFLEAYTRWAESEGNPLFNLLENRQYGDVDTTPEEYLYYFREQFLKNIPQDVLCDKRLLVKKIKDFYRARGSEQSFKFLFNILFNVELSLYYPKQDILRASNGNWITEYSMVLGSVSDDIRNITMATVIGETSRAFCVSVQAFLSQDSVYYITVRDLNGEFVVGENVTLTDVDGTEYTAIVGSCVSEITITDPGSGYSLGDVIPASGCSNCKIVVSGIVSAPINEIQIFSAGLNYQSGEHIYFTGSNPAIAVIRAVGGSGELLSLEILSGGSYSTLGGVTYTIDTENGTGAILAASGDNIGGVRKCDIIVSGSGATSGTLNFAGSGEGDATGTYLANSILRKRSKYFGYDGFLSSWNFIFDGHYYQEYSYALSSEKDFEDYQIVVRKVNHPSGMKMYGTRLYTRYLDADDYYSGGDFFVKYMTLTVPQYQILTISQFIALEI